MWNLTSKLKKRRGIYPEPKVVFVKRQRTGKRRRRIPYINERTGSGGRATKTKNLTRRKTHQDSLEEKAEGGNIISKNRKESAESRPTLT